MSSKGKTEDFLKFQDLSTRSNEAFMSICLSETLVMNYEPELHPGVTYKLQSPKATLKIFSTGSVTVTAPSVADVQAAIEYIYPLIYEFRKERSREELEALAKKKHKQDLCADAEATLAGTDDIKEQMDTDDENWGD